MRTRLNAVGVLTRRNPRRQRRIVTRKRQRMQWYFCLEDQQVEPEDGCANAERLGPYESEHAARQALERAAERNAAFDDDDD